MIHDVLHSNANECVGGMPRASAGGGGHVSGASLGIYAKSYSADINDSQKARSSRVHRYALQSVVRDILPNSRTAKCHRYRAPKREIEVWRGVSAGVAGKAFYKGLLVCGLL